MGRTSGVGFIRVLSFSLFGISLLALGGRYSLGFELPEKLNSKCVDLKFKALKSDSDSFKKKQITKFECLNSALTQWKYPDKGSKCEKKFKSWHLDKTVSHLFRDHLSLPVQELGGVSVHQAFQGFSYDVHGDATQLEPGDVLILNPNLKADHILSEHMLVVDKKDSDGVFVYEDVHPIGVHRFYKPFPAFSLNVEVQIAEAGESPKLENIEVATANPRFIAYRFTNLEFRSIFLHYLFTRWQAGTKYSMSKAVGKALQNSHHKLTKKEELQLVTHWLKDLVYAQMVGFDTDSEKFQKYNKDFAKYYPDELCSTFIGNPALEAALSYRLQKVTASPELKAEYLGSIDAIAFVVNHLEKVTKTELKQDKIFKEYNKYANGLLHSKPFREMLEFDTSQVYKSNVDQMLPSVLFEYFMNFGNECFSPMNLFQ